MTTRFLVFPTPNADSPFSDFPTPDAALASNSSGHALGACRLQREAAAGAGPSFNLHFLSFQAEGKMLWESRRLTLHWYDSRSHSSLVAPPWTKILAPPLKLSWHLVGPLQGAAFCTFHMQQLYFSQHYRKKKNYIILWLGHKAIPIDILLITAFTWSTYDCISGSKLIASNKLVTKKRMTSTVRLEAHICTCGMDIAWTNNNGSNVVLLISNLTLEFRSSLILSW